MVLVGPLLGGIMSGLSGLIFYFVGRTVSQRDLVGSDRTANTLFVVWWQCLAGLSFAGAVFNVAGALGYTDLALHTVLLYVAIIVLCACLWGLGYYLVYLYTGRKQWLLPLGAFYSFFAVLLLYLIIVAEPARVVAGRWAMTLEYEHPEALTARQDLRILFFFFSAPQILASIGYMSLLFKVDLPTQRFRIGLVSGAFLAWFGSGLVASILGIAQTDAWSVASRLISVGSALAILLAYRPPKPVIGWLAVRERRHQAAREVAHG